MSVETAMVVHLERSLFLMLDDEGAIFRTGDSFDESPFRGHEVLRASSEVAAYLYLEFGEGDDDLFAIEPKVGEELVVFDPKTLKKVSFGKVLAV